MDGTDLLTVLLVVVGGVVLSAVAAIVWLMRRYRVPPRGLIAMVGALIYLASPIDVLPEALLGPVGLLDDAGVVGAVTVFVYKLVHVQKKLRGAGIQGRVRPPRLQ